MAFGIFGRHVTSEIENHDLTFVDCSNVDRMPSDYRPNDGDVYFAKPEKSNLVKIGKCGFGQASKRIFDLQLGCPEKLELLGVIPNGGLRLEHQIHRKFAKYHFCREWFYLTDEVTAFIAMECQ